MKVKFELHNSHKFTEDDSNFIRSVKSFFDEINKTEQEHPEWVLAFDSYLQDLRDLSKVVYKNKYQVEKIHSQDEEIGLFYMFARGKTVILIAYERK